MKPCCLPISALSQLRTLVSRMRSRRCSGCLGQATVGRARCSDSRTCCFWPDVVGRQSTQRVPSST